MINFLYPWFQLIELLFLFFLISLVLNRIGVSIHSLNRTSKMSVFLNYQRNEETWGKASTDKGVPAFLFIILLIESCYVYFSYDLPGLLQVFVDLMWSLKMEGSGWLVATSSVLTSRFFNGCRQLRICFFIFIDAMQVSFNTRQNIGAAVMDLHWISNRCDTFNELRISQSLMIRFINLIVAGDDWRWSLGCLLN